MKKIYLKYVGYAMFFLAVLMTVPAVLFKPGSWWSFWFIYNGTTTFLMGFLYLIIYKLFVLDEKIDRVLVGLDTLDHGSLLTLLSEILLKQKKKKMRGGGK